MLRNSLAARAHFVLRNGSLKSVSQRLGSPSRAAQMPAVQMCCSHLVLARSLRSISLAMPVERLLAPAHLIKAGPDVYSSHWRHGSLPKWPAFFEWTNLLRQKFQQSCASFMMLSVQQSKHVGLLAGSLHARPSSENCMPTSRKHCFISPSVCGRKPSVLLTRNFVAHAVICCVIDSRVSQSTCMSDGMLQAPHLPQCSTVSPRASRAALPALQLWTVQLDAYDLGVAPGMPMSIAHRYGVE
mmetsp:Transcript_3172/g.6586  ORF Transcript_3172/g.6586 Transcript_3172/m.6586 type:complete len:242 (+) Transcript_3172:434-1159(+)